MKNKVFTISILVVAILLLSIGFAAFTSILKVETNATYTPDSDSFKIKFSKVSDSIVEGTNNPISPISGSGANAIIINEGNPKISNLQAHFTRPGETVVYEFYAVNETPYNAYLTLINFLNIQGTAGTKECAGSNGASQSLVNKACEEISVKIEVGEITATKTTTVNNHKLSRNSSEKIRVTIQNTSTAVDGDMTVTFGDISLTYSTADEQVEELPETDSTLYTGTIYRNSNETLYIGDNINIRNTWCAVVPGVANSCVENEYYNQIFDSETECETTLEAIANSGELDETTQYLVANAVCEQGTLSYETNVANISQNYYLKHDVVNNVVTASYACITYTEDGIRKDVCLRGYDTTYYASNQAILRSVEPYFNTLDYKSSSYNNYKGYCYFDDSPLYCYSDSLRLYAYSGGDVYAYDGSVNCGVNSFGLSRCFEE